MYQLVQLAIPQCIPVSRHYVYHKYVRFLFTNYKTTFVGFFYIYLKNLCMCACVHTYVCKCMCT